MKKGLLALAFGGLSIGMTEFTMMGILPDIAGDIGVNIPVAAHLIALYALGVLLEHLFWFCSPVNIHLKSTDFTDVDVLCLMVFCHCANSLEYAAYKIYVRITTWSFLV